MHDLVIRNGKVVDGTGRDAFRADVAIDGEIASAVGEVQGSAWRTIDFESLEMDVPEFVNDFPAAAGRWTQRARGYEHTIVNGQIVIEGGCHTGRLPGQLVRGASSG